MKTLQSIKDGYGFTILRIALPYPWTLPRAKNMPPACFCTSVRTGAALSSPSRAEREIKERIPGWVSSLLFGTPEGTRTPNPRNRNPMLYPLSHRCMLHSPIIITRFESFVKGVICLILPINPRFCGAWRRPELAGGAADKTSSAGFSARSNHYPQYRSFSLR